MKVNETIMGLAQQFSSFLFPPNTYTVMALMSEYEINKMKVGRNKNIDEIHSHKSMLKTYYKERFSSGWLDNSWPSKHCSIIVLIY